MRLDELKPGETAKIRSVRGEQRLTELGLTPGERIRCLRRAPFGGPMEVTVGGTVLAIRLRDGALIEVEPAGAGAGSVESRTGSASFAGRYAAAMPEITRPLTLALMGNPNCGKTTLFNCLTGREARVGNLPGVTVERQEGAMRGAASVTVMDLPGIYSLTARSIDERAALKALEDRPPDAIVCVLDVSALRRGMYLVTEVLELGVPVVVALNMMDELIRDGGQADGELLSQRLRVPVLPLSAARGWNVEALKAKAVLAALEGKSPRKPTPADSPEERYRLVDRLIPGVVTAPERRRGRERSERLDRLLLGRFTGLPLLCLILAGIFFLTFELIGPALRGALEGVIVALGGAIRKGMEASGVAPPLRELITEGILSGVGEVLGFLPVILTLLTLLAFLEDSGYMARAAFLLDAPMRKLGLSGRSAVPLLMGFGCTASAVMAARTLPTRESRRRTILLTPFMSCSAKLPVYTLLASASFPRPAFVIGALYLLGILLGIVTALPGRREEAELVMELPDYRLPRTGNVLRILKNRAGDLLRRVFSVIFLSSLLIWFLRYFSPSFRPAGDPEGSLLAFLAGGIAPVFGPLGLDDWRVVTAILAGFFAKENVASTLVLLLGAGGVAALLTPASTLSMLVFCLLYTPCTAAVAAVRRELGTRWAVFMVLYQCLAAYLFAAAAGVVFGLFLS